MSQTYTIAEVAAHKDEANGLWIAVKDNVYDITKFMDEHPGGSKILKRFAGKEATKAFQKYHSDSVLEKYGDKYKIGTLAAAAKL